MPDTVLFSFPAVSLSFDGDTDPAQTAGFLILSSSSQPTDWDPSRYDTFLRIQHTPDYGSQSVDVLVEAYRELHKVSPTSFALETSFGELHIIFPDLHQLVPQHDARLDLPAEVRSIMTWDNVVTEFENEIDRFVSYRKNGYSLIDGGYGGEKAKEAGFGSPPIPQYDPASYSDDKKGAGAGRVVLIDEENGNEVGGMQVQSLGVTPGSKDPVEITLPEDGEGPVVVRPAQPEAFSDYLRDANSPEYAKSSLVQGAASASRLIVTTAAYLSEAMSSGAAAFAQKTKPTKTPMTFQPSTHARVAQVHNFTTSASKLSSAAVGGVSRMAQNAGAKLAGKDKSSSTREPGQPSKPNILNRSLIAFSTIADGIDYASKNLLHSSSSAASTMVGHRYGAEAGRIADTVIGSVKNCGLVYIDASGVSRRAVVKGVAKGMVVGKVKGGGEVVVPSSQGPIGAPPGYSPGGSNELYYAPPPTDGGRGSPMPPTGSGKGAEAGQFKF